MLRVSNIKEVRMIKDQEIATHEDRSKHEKELLDEMKFYADLQLGIFKALMDYVNGLEKEIKELREKNEQIKKEQSK